MQLICTPASDHLTEHGRATPDCFSGTAVFQKNSNCRDVSPHFLYLTPSKLWQNTETSDCAPRTLELKRARIFCPLNMERKLQGLRWKFENPARLIERMGHVLIGFPAYCQYYRVWARIKWLKGTLHVVHVKHSRKHLTAPFENHPTESPCHTDSVCRLIQVSCNLAPLGSAEHRHPLFSSLFWFGIMFL